MKFYFKFTYDRTVYFSELTACIKAAKKPKTTPQLTFIFSVSGYLHTPIRAIVNGRVYGNKHARLMGFPNVWKFGPHQFKLLNKLGG